MSERKTSFPNEHSFLELLEKTNSYSCLTNLLLYWSHLAQICLTELQNSTKDFSILNVYKLFTWPWFTFWQAPVYWHVFTWINIFKMSSMLEGVFILSIYYLWSYGTVFDRVLGSQMKTKKDSRNFYGFFNFFDWLLENF